MRCDDVRAGLDPYLDEELTALETACIQEHLTGCDDCRTALQSTASLHALLTADALTDGVPPTLRDAVMDGVRREARATYGVLGRSSPRLFRLVNATAAGILVMALILVGVRAISIPRTSDFVALHEKAIAAGTLELEVSDPHDIAKWLNERLGVAITIPARTPPGDRVVGARGSTIAGQPVVQVLYAGGGPPWSLFISPRALQRQPDDVEHVLQGVDVYVSEVAGTRVGWWRDRDRVYVAVAAVDVRDLLGFAVVCIELRRAALPSPGPGPLVARVASTLGPRVRQRVESETRGDQR